MKFITHQLSGAGNTFSVTWENAETKLIKDRPEVVRQICAATQTDGFIFLSWLDQSTHSFKWDFYNNDGSKAEMCGNATRCVAFYAKNILQIEGNHLSLQTAAGLIDIKILDKELFEIRMTALQKFEHPKYFWCDTGVPHIVIEIDDFANYRARKAFCKDLRFHADFAPRGTNVTLVQLDQVTNKLKAVSYERGVEDFTAACGTGAMAAAFYNLTKRGQLETLVEMPGGLLKMNLSDLQNPVMTGSAVQLGEFTYATTSN
jgi:diaminopimelate epimerase